MAHDAQPRQQAGVGQAAAGAHHQDVGPEPRLTELLKQGQYTPLPVEEQVCVIFAGVNGYCDAIETDQIQKFEEGLLALLRNEHGDLLAAIRDDGEISDDTDAKLRGALDRFVASFG